MPPTARSAAPVRHAPLPDTLVGEHSLLVTEDDEWLRHRKLLGPVFHRDHVESYADEIAAIAC